MNFTKILINIVKTPLFIVQLGTGAKSFSANPIIGSKLFNQWKLHHTRLRLAAYMASYRRKKLASRISIRDCEEFSRDGYFIKEDFLPLEEFKKLHLEVFQTDWDVREMRQGGTTTRRVPFDLALLESTTPSLAKFICAPYIKNLIRYAASTGGSPIFWLQAVVAGQEKAAHDPQTDVHADTFQSTAKAWFFLQDVELEDGPLAYVPGSHRLTEERLAWEHEQSLIAAKHPVIYHARGSFRATKDDLSRMNFPNPKRFTVKANTLVIADTFGFHARTPALRPTCRVEIYASLRRNPFRPWLGLDFFSLPYLRNRSGSAHLKALNALKWAGLKMPWKPAGTKKINAS